MDWYGATHGFRFRMLLCAHFMHLISMIIQFIGSQLLFGPVGWPFHLGIHYCSGIPHTECETEAGYITRILFYSASVAKRPYIRAQGALLILNASIELEVTASVSPCGFLCVQ